MELREISAIARSLPARPEARRADRFTLRFVSVRARALYPYRRLNQRQLVSAYLRSELTLATKTGAIGTSGCARTLATS